MNKYWIKNAEEVEGKTPNKVIGNFIFNDTENNTSYDLMIMVFHTFSEVIKSETPSYIWYVISSCNKFNDETQKHDLPFNFFDLADELQQAVLMSIEGD